MKNSYLNILGATVISTIAIGSLVFTGGCKSQEVLKDRPFVPAPSNQEPANPPSVAPVVATPIVVQPVLSPAPVVEPPVAKPVPVPAETIPK